MILEGLKKTWKFCPGAVDSGIHLLLVVAAGDQSLGLCWQAGRKTTAKTADSNENDKRVLPIAGWMIQPTGCCYWLPWSTYRP